MDKGNNIELRTDEVRDILQKMPGWTIRWGISVIFIAVILLLLFSYFYRYPDLIRSEVLISASNPPADIRARATGKISEIMVADNEKVIKGQRLAVVENSANSTNIEELEVYLKKIQPFVLTLSMDSYNEAPRNLMLGEIQSTYADFQKRLSDYSHFINQAFYDKRLKAIDGQIRMKNRLLERLELQFKLEQERFQLASASFKRDSLLYFQKTISQEDFETSRSKWLNAGLTFEMVQMERVNTNSAIFELQQQKATLQLEYDNISKAFKTNISKTYELAISQIQYWYLRYVITSPMNGVTSFNRVWSINQNIKEGETVMTIVPENPEGIMGKAIIPIKGAGKVKPGQRVNIKLSNYPYMEYGMLIGVVKTIAPVPVNNYYAIEIELPNQLTTNYNRKLGMQQELLGNCEIITDDLRLIQRFVYPIKALVERNKR